MFESQYVELLPARTTMKACRPRKRGGSGNYHSGNTTNTGGAGGSGGSGGGGAGGFGVNVNVNPQIALFGDNSSSTTQNAGNGGAGGAGGAGGSAG